MLKNDQAAMLLQSLFTIRFFAYKSPCKTSGTSLHLKLHDQGLERFENVHYLHTTVVLRVRASVFKLQ